MTTHSCSPVLSLCCFLFLGACHVKALWQTGCAHKRQLRAMRETLGRPPGLLGVCFVQSLLRTSFHSGVKADLEPAWASKLTCYFHCGNGDVIHIPKLLRPRIHICPESLHLVGRTVSMPPSALFIFWF